MIYRVEDRVAPKWRKLRNIIKREDAIGFSIKEFPSCNVIVYKFKCLICPKIIEVRLKHIPYSTGKCKKHANMHRPFEAVYGGLRRGAKERGIEFKLTYENYIEFTKNKSCHYCDRDIPWNPYNEHGKNNPGYYLDRKDPDKGYSKDNCVASCSRCNLAKRSLKYLEWIDLCKMVANNHKTHP